MKKLLVISAVLVFIFTSCGKYEDGPMFSLASKKSRVVNTWRLDREFVNGSEVSLSADDKDDYFELRKDGSATYTWVSGNSSTSFSGGWEFDDSKEHLILSITFTVLGQTTTEKTTYKILRLKSNEMWLEEVDGNDTYKYYYVTK